MWVDDCGDLGGGHLPHCPHPGHVDIMYKHSRLMARRGQHLAPGIYQRRVAPGRIATFLRTPRRAHTSDIHLLLKPRCGPVRQLGMTHTHTTELLHLVVHCTSTQQQLPVGWPGCGVEGTRVHDHAGTSRCSAARVANGGQQNVSTHVTAGRARAHSPCPLPPSPTSHNAC